MPQSKTMQSELVASCNGDFRIFLGKELERRRKNNPHYSLRAFAKSLGLDNTRLSRMLRDERPTSPEFVAQVGQRLGLAPSEVEVFRSIAAARKSMQGLSKRTRKGRYVTIDNDVFESIEDWRHYAILELMKLDGFQNTAEWIGAALGISEEEAQAYIDRLVRVELLEILEDGTWVDRSSGSRKVELSDFETSRALKRVQNKFLEMAMSALENIPMDRRDHSVIMMATHTSKIAGAKKIINKFRYELCAFLEDCDEHDMVYAFSAALFPVLPSPKGELNEV